METYSYPFMFVRLLFFLSMFLLLLIHSLSSLQPLCHEDERSALLQFKDSLIITQYSSSYPFAYPKLASWTLNSTDCCSWDGVECNEDSGNVIGLDLSSSFVYGSINSDSSLFRLLQLQRLNLADNDFNSSQIPSAVGNLLRLDYLNLSYSVFSGQIPSELSHLSKLSTLDLSRTYNLSIKSDLRSLVQNFTSLKELLLSEVKISSAIPKSLANLSSLTTLDLENCQLHGEFPTRIFQLPNLQDLRIGGNQNLTGHLPEFHSSNPSLKVLMLRFTSFSGELPASIGNLSSLNVLDVGNCKLSGSIPLSLSNLTQIIYLDLSFNSLTGHIPNSFSELKSIESLDFRENNLGGVLELDMFLKLKSLSVLMLSSNNLTILTKANLNDTLPQFDTLALGSCNLRNFPDFLRNQNNLSRLELPNNNIQGLIPRWMYNASIEALRVIVLSDNFLVGFEQSPIVLPWSNLESLDLSSNMLQGSLPIPPPSIKIYQVQRNLIRQMSPLICNLSSLEVLYLSYNNLSGKLHPCFGNFSSLSILQLRSNKFHGTIPRTWATGSSLNMIDLSENQFQGQLPSSMANCMMLEYLHVGNNQINDTFPFWLGTLSQLEVLVLRSNGFHGAIKSPETNYTFPALHIIDLSHNSFSGNLPAEYFLDWKAMKDVGANQLKYMEVSFSVNRWDSTTVQYTVTMTNKGIKLEYEKIQDVFRVIDFSSNKFEGEIPELVGSLTGLHLLNLSNNVLTGYIPPSMANLTHIESMDLSQNKLFGEIPPQLTQLFSLEYFNVSNNHLTGPVPHGNQFDTFQNNSFGGNPGLCGSPLSKKCEDFTYTPTLPSPFEENQSSESSFEFGWKVVVIGYGCGFVIGIVIGQIVIARKYDWFVKTFGNMQKTRRMVNWRMS